jgi:hypothetical protein
MDSKQPKREGLGKKSKSGRGHKSPVAGTAPEFFDIHCHAHTLSHPSFLALIQTLRARRLEAIYSQITSFEYIASSFFHRGGEKLRNMLSVMENEPGDIFMLMEDDLKGVYAKPGKANKADDKQRDDKPLIASGLLKIGSQKYGKLVISPLLTDFNQPGPYKPDTYYDKFPRKTIEAQIIDVLIGIKEYRRARPDGLLEIYPFLGINPQAYTPESLTSFLDTWLSDFTRDRKEGRAVFEAMEDFVIDETPRKHSPFAGIKLYPPLGFDPWPAKGIEREKVEILYSFAEKRRIPMVTHCDDGGFRVLPLEDAWRQTSPTRYRPVMERHPGLIINFAHLGNQYSMPMRLTPATEWRDEIFALMVDYPGVYSDFSFNGVVPEYYGTLIAVLESLAPSMRDVVEKRIMFGSDFMVNLLKIRSYTDYFRIFSSSKVDPALKKAFGSENPRRFLWDTATETE